MSVDDQSTWAKFWIRALTQTDKAITKSGDKDESGSVLAVVHDLVAWVKNPAGDEHASAASAESAAAKTTDAKDSTGGIVVAAAIGGDASASSSPAASPAEAAAAASAPAAAAAAAAREQIVSLSSDLKLLCDAWACSFATSDGKKLSSMQCHMMRVLFLRAEAAFIDSAAQMVDSLTCVSFDFELAELGDAKDAKDSEKDNTKKVAVKDPSCCIAQSAATVVHSCSAVFMRCSTHTY
jgi:hypothetical protein